MNHIRPTPSKPEATPASTRVVAVTEDGVHARQALTQDELDLARTGHAQQLQRSLGFWSMLATVYILSKYFSSNCAI